MAPPKAHHPAAATPAFPAQRIRPLSMDTMMIPSRVTSSAGTGSHPSEEEGENGPTMSPKPYALEHHRQAS